MPPRSRRPRTVLASKYSIRERQRVRYSLASYRFRRGLSVERLYYEIDDFPEFQGVFKDRQIIREFLEGAEQSDEKIDTYIRYLIAVDPKLEGAFGEDDFEAQIADVFSQMFQPELNETSMRESWERTERFAGFYQFVREELPTEASRTQILHLETIPNAHYLRASLLEIHWSLHPDAPEEFTKLKFPVTATQIGGVRASYDDDEEGRGADKHPMYDSSTRANESFAKLLLSETRGGRDPTIPYFYEASGFLFPRDDTHFFMFQRDTDNFSPIFYMGGLFDGGNLQLSYFDANQQLLRLHEGKMPIICDYLSYRKLPEDIGKIIQSFLASIHKDMRQ